MDLSTLRQATLFRHLSTEQLQNLIRRSRSVFLDSNELFLKTGPETEFFMVETGEIEISKRTALNKHGCVIKVLREGEIAAETAFIKGETRETTIRAAKPSKIIVFTINNENRSCLETKSKLFELLMETLQEENNIACEENVIENINAHLDQTRAQTIFGNFIVNLLILIFLYIYGIQFISLFKLQVISTTFISVPVIGLFAGCMLYIIKKNGYSLNSYGFIRNGSGRAALEALLYCIPFFAIVILIKWLYIHLVPRFHHLSLFHISADLRPGETPVSPWVFAALVIVYGLFVPIQEFVFRGIIQGRLQEFLLGRHKVMRAILISNLPFSMIHLHLSFSLAFFAYLSGLFWGWLYSKQKNLIGCSIHHFIVGAWSFFIIGAQDVLTF